MAVAALGLGTLALAETPHQAIALSTAHVYFDSRWDFTDLYVDGDGEGNDVRVEADSLGGFTVTDSSGMVAGKGCTSSSPTLVTCGGYADSGITLRLGDGNDQAVVDAPTAWVGIHGEEGRDTLRSVDPGSDYLMFGDAGADRLFGSDGWERLSGGGGNDLLRGRADGDELVGGTGSDRLLGGRGWDQLDAVDSEEDRAVSCGAGTDSLAVDPIDPKPGTDCERVDIAPRPAAGSLSP